MRSKGKNLKRNLSGAIVLFIPFMLFGCGGDRGFTPAANLQESQKASPPFFEGKRTIKVEAYTLPPQVESQKEQTEAEGLQDDLEYQISRSAKKLQLEGLGFTVDLDQKKMRFQGRLKEKDRVIEEIDLEGNFEPQKSPWRSDDLFPVNSQVRAEKRMQATAVCLDANVCDQVAVRFFIRYEGELLVLQFEKKTLTLKSPKASASLEDVLTEPAGTTTLAEVKEEEKAKVDEDEVKEEKDMPLPQPKASLVEDEGENEEQKEEEVSDQLQMVLDEYSAPTQTPSPKVTKDSVQGIEKYTHLVINDAVAQAIGKHTAGRLERANTFPLDGKGFTRRDRKSSQQVYGTQVMVDLLQLAAQETNKQFPGRPPISIGNISRKHGGKAGHSSHQTGLDVDIAFPRLSSKSTQFWNPLQGGGGLSGEMDTERFWNFTKNLVCAKRASNGDSKTVIAIFVDKQIKSQVCRFAQGRGEDLKSPSSCAYQTLRSFYHWAGHKNHIHVRLHCPPTVGCKESRVTLPRETGC